MQTEGFWFDSIKTSGFVDLLFSTRRFGYFSPEGFIGFRELCRALFDTFFNSAKVTFYLTTRSTKDTEEDIE